VLDERPWRVLDIDPYVFHFSFFFLPLLEMIRLHVVYKLVSFINVVIVCLLYMYHYPQKQKQNRYFTPTTEEEREEWGEQVHEQQRKNLARQYIDAVRRRKGQFVDAKVVVHAEKQRTRKTG